MPSNSSPVITRLLHAHGIVLGKTNMEELAEGLTTINPVYGPVLNPYNNLHDVGGKPESCCLSMCFCISTLLLRLLPVKDSLVLILCLDSLDLGQQLRLRPTAHDSGTCVGLRTTNL